MTEPNMRLQRDAAIRLLDGLENGRMSAADAVIVAVDLDPVLVYTIVSFLRAVYPATDPAATAVLERVVRLTSASPAILRLHREGGQDPVSHWFESEHAYAAFRGRGAEMLALLVDKLDS